MTGSAPNYDIKAWAHLDSSMDGAPDRTIWTTAAGIMMADAATGLHITPPVSHPTRCAPRITRQSGISFISMAGIFCGSGS